MSTTKTIQVEQISYKDLLQSFESIVSEKVSEALKNQPVNPPAPEFLSREDVAKIFGVTLSTVHAWMNAGILTPYKIGAKTRFKRTEVLESPKAMKLDLNA